MFSAKRNASSLTNNMCDAIRTQSNSANQILIHTYSSHIQTVLPAWLITSALPLALVSTYACACLPLTTTRISLPQFCFRATRVDAHRGIPGYFSTIAKKQVRTRNDTEGAKPAKGVDRSSSRKETQKGVGPCA